jgi:hypothetical protein
MKAHTLQLVSLEEIVNKALSDLLEGAHRKEQFLMWGLDYYRKYRMNLAREVKTVSLDMTPWKSVILPDDCVDWIMVGIRNGELINTFTKAALAPRDCACDEDAPTEAEYKAEPGSEGVVYYNCFGFGDDAGKMYGLMHKDNGLGYFDPNPNQGVNEIQLSAKVAAGTKIYLMYLSSLFDPDRGAVVHPYCEDMVRYGIHYENLKHKRRSGNRNISPVDVKMAKDELDEEICLVAERRWDLSPEDVIAAAREGYRQIPKN